MVGNGDGEQWLPLFHLSLHGPVDYLQSQLCVFTFCLHLTTRQLKHHYLRRYTVDLLESTICVPHYTIQHYNGTADVYILYTF